MSDSENKVSYELISEAFKNIRLAFQQASAGLTFYLGISYFSFGIAIYEKRLMYYRMATTLINLIITITLGVFLWMIDYFVSKNIEIISLLDINNKNILDRIGTTTAKVTRLCIVLATLCIAAALIAWLALLVRILVLQQQ